jgi:glycosyltransferase involved in cell wall biosynthesis
MQEVVKQISQKLVRIGHDVTVATTYLPERKETNVNGVKIVEFDVHGGLVRGIVGEVERYQHFLTSSDFDIITHFAAQQWATDAALPILNKIKSKKVFVPTGFSYFYKPEFRRYYQRMKTWMNNFDMNIFLSNDYRDINFAHRCKVKKIMVIPNGADDDEFLPQTRIDIRKRLEVPHNHLLILHVGTHTGKKGHAEALEIFSKANIPNSTFLMVANSFPGRCQLKCRAKEILYNRNPIRLLDRKRVIVTILPREETIAAYKEADVFLFPSNIECSPLVLFECMASKTPFLTTDVGNTKEIISWSKSGVLLPTIKDNLGFSKAEINKSAQILEKILANHQLRATMAKSGYKAWLENFTWTKIAKRYEELYLSLLK